MIWLFQQLWLLMLVALILGFACTWLWMVRKVQAERAQAHTTTRVTEAKASAPAKAAAAKKDTDPAGTLTESTAPAAAAVGATAAAAGAATYAVGRFGKGSVDALPDGAQPHGYTIKGNADSMLYHTPESPSYRQCTAEVWFSDEESAQAAGFRRWDSHAKHAAAEAETHVVASEKPATVKPATVAAPEPHSTSASDDDNSRVHLAGAAAAVAGTAAGIATGAASARGPKPTVVEGSDNVDSRGAHDAPAGGVTYAVGRYGAGSVDPLPGGAMPVGYSIKGNEDSMKYHTLESPSYSQCKPEVWFKDESSAQLAGFSRWDAKPAVNDAHVGIAEEPKHVGVHGEAEQPLAPTSPAFSSSDDVVSKGSRVAAATAGVTAGMYAAGAFGDGSVDPLPNGAQPVGYAIKGNAQSKLYHTEQSPSYGQCKAEVWFRDEATAEAAGFQHWDKSRRSGSDSGPAESSVVATYPVGSYGAGSVDPLPDNAQPEGFDIKGNAQSMLFHTPESPSYKACIAEVWFKDEDSAKAAGFKHWDRRKRGL